MPLCGKGHPLLLEGLGEAFGEAFSIYTYLSVKQIVTKVFAELVTPVPPKTIAFWIKLLTFANREQKPISLYSHPTYNLTPNPSPKDRGVNKKDKPQDV